MGRISTLFLTGLISTLGANAFAAPNPLFERGVVVRDGSTVAIVGWTRLGTRPPTVLDLVTFFDATGGQVQISNVPVQVLEGTQFYATPFDQLILPLNTVRARVTIGRVVVAELEVWGTLAEIGTYIPYGYGGCPSCVLNYVCFCETAGIKACPAEPLPPGYATQCTAPPLP